ncbi:MAG: aminopeptidase [Desulfurococcales archaeon]|nr:aminopeptidase [Desulfurococcales archaeon]
MLYKFAKLIADYCTEVRKGDEVLVSASIEALPLVRELWKAIVSKSAYPIFSLRDDILSEIFYKYASEDLLKHKSKIDIFIAENIDVRISILSPTHTKPLIGVDPEKIGLRRRALKKLTEVFMRRDAEGSLRWVVTAYPTNSLAQEAGMSPLEYSEFVFKSLKLYSDDPVRSWIQQRERQQKIVNFLNKVSELRFISEDTDILVRVDGRTWINDDGKKNMPGGEVFTGPHEDCTEGHIVFTYPAIWSGVEVEGVRLVFKRGRVVEANAAKGEEFLRKIIEVDEGARRLGEVAFGLNYDIGRFTKEILFDEKIGGTIHMALGASYPSTGGKNTSAIHWDMIKDMKKDGKVYADGDLIYENGRFLEEVLG